MKKFFNLSLFIGLFFALASAFYAQTPKNILKQAEKALGGKKNLEKVSSREKKGLITRLKDGAEGDFILQTATPAFYREFYDFDGFEIESGFNGKSGWIRDSREGLKTFVGDESRDFQTLADFRNTLWLDYKKDKSKLVGGGTATVDGKRANVILLTTAKGVPVKLYFDAANFLLLREEIPFGDMMQTFDYADYRVISGVKEAFQMKITSGEDVYEVRFDQIEHNKKLAANTFDFPNVSGEPLPDIAKLLRELQANQENIENILENYSYTQKTISRAISDKGILKETGSETFRLSFYKGYRIQRLIEKNGKPLTEQQQNNEDKEVQKRVAEIEKQIAKDEARAVKQSADGTPDEESRRISIAEVLRASNLINPRRERLKGRDVIVFDFEPNPNFDFNNAKSFLKFFGKTAGVMWIDEQDKQVARIEAVLADSYKVGGGVLAKLRQGASFTLEQERVNDEIWLPSAVDINLSVRVLLFKNIAVNQVIKSYDYRKFSTEVKDAKIEEIVKP